jgi:hypothetical protein
MIITYAHKDLLKSPKPVFVESGKLPAFNDLPCFLPEVMGVSHSIHNYPYLKRVPAKEGRFLLRRKMLLLMRGN